MAETVQKHCSKQGVYEDVLVRQSYPIQSTSARKEDDEADVCRDGCGALRIGGMCAGACPCPEAPDYWQLSDSWRFGAAIDAYLPNVGLKTTLPDDASSDVSIGINRILGNLKMGFPASAEAQKGRWGAYTDVLYMDLGSASSKTRNFTLGREQLPADISASITIDMKATIWTLGSSYRAMANPDLALDVLAGARLFDVKVNQGWQFSGNIGSIPLSGRTGSGEASVSLWDAIIGVKGRFALNADRTWFAPYYLDVGTGESRLTWQVLGGIGYAFNWGDVTATRRYLAYKSGSGTPIQDMNMSGPQIAFVFRW